MPLTTDEQREMEELELQKLEQEKASSSAKTFSAPPQQADQADVPRTLGGLVSLPGRIMDTMAEDAAALKQRGWENLGLNDRVRLLALSLPEYAGREIMGGAKTAEGMIERAAPIAIGQFAGRATRIPGADRALGAIGGAMGEALAEHREGGDISAGRVMEAAISGAVRGKPLAGASAAETIKEGAKYAAVNIGGRAVAAGIDEGRLPTPGEIASSAGVGMAGAFAARALSREGGSAGRHPLFSLENKTLSDLRKEGVVIPPHEIGEGSDILASIGGKAALQQEASKRNQFVWQRLARSDVGLSKEALPILPSELAAIRLGAATPYREIQQMQQKAKAQLEEQLARLAEGSDPFLGYSESQQLSLQSPEIQKTVHDLGVLARADVDGLKKARFEMQRARRAFFSGDPNAYGPWQAAKTRAQELENAIEKAADMTGDGALADRLRESRKIIAKTYAVEDAVNPGNGFVDPLSFGRQLLNDEPLDGNLEKIAKFQLAFRREAVEAGRVPAPGVGNLGAQLSTGMISQGDVPGLVGGLVNATAGKAVRPFLLSDMVQSGMLTPHERQNLAAVMARYLVEAARERDAYQQETESAPTPVEEPAPASAP